MMIKRVLAASLLTLSISVAANARSTPNAQGPAQDVSCAKAGSTNVVLVHGGTTDGSGWKEVFAILRKRGLTVTVVELPHTSLGDDIATAKLAVSVQSGPTILVGHSYGGAVTTEAGAASNVKALVYVAAFQPDVGETIAEISSRVPMGIDMKMVGEKRFVPNPATYHEMLGSDRPRDVTDFMAASAKPMRVDTFQIKFQHAAWHDKPSFGIVTTNDKVLSPAFLRWMYGRSNTKFREVKASHMVYMSHPQATAIVILEAAAAGK